jgi:gluconate 2-dehydrogenase gamma chain
MKRRAFLTAAGAAAACSRRPAAAPGYRVLTVNEVAALEAWCDGLIPPDQDAGGADARVPRFIDLQLTRKYRKLLPKYREALAAFAAWRAQSPDAPVESLLGKMEKGEAPKDLFPGGGKDAFEMVLTHAMQGYYGSPRHGGNRDYVSWKMLGVPMSPVRGREHYTIGEAKS